MFVSQLCYLSFTTTPVTNRKGFGGDQQQIREDARKVSLSASAGKVFV